MGSLSIPLGGSVYLDANAIIYTVEKHPTYGPLLEPLWQAAQTTQIEIVCSELVILETLVGPLKTGDSLLEQAYETLFLFPQTQLVPINQPILREGADCALLQSFAHPTRFMPRQRCTRAVPCL